MANRKKTRHSITRHARSRMQERAISEIQVKLIEVFGRYTYQKGGGEIAYIPEKELQELRHAVNKLDGITIVVGKEQKIITAMHQNEKIRTTEYN